MSGPGKALTIDIPVRMSEARVVFSIGALPFEGDLPAVALPRAADPE